MCVIRGGGSVVLYTTAHLGRCMKAYSVQSVNNYELTQGTAHYCIILISQCCNSYTSQPFYIYIYILEF